MQWHLVQHMKDTGICPPDWTLWRMPVVVVAVLAAASGCEDAEECSDYCRKFCHNKGSDCVCVDETDGKCSCSCDSAGAVGPGDRFIEGPVMNAGDSGAQGQGAIERGLRPDGVAGW